MVDQPGRFMRTDQIAGEILQPDIPVLSLAGRQVGAVDARHAPRLHHAGQSPAKNWYCHERLTFASVAKVAFAVRIDEQVAERRGEYGAVDGPPGMAHALDAIRVVDGPSGPWYSGCGTIVPS